MKNTQALALILVVSLGLAACSSPTASNPASVNPPNSGSSGSSTLSITPTSARAGSPDVQLVISGSGFRPGPHLKSIVMWSTNGAKTSLATTFVSTTQLTAVIPAALLTSPGSADIFVQTWDPMGDVPPTNTSPFAFTIVPSSSAMFVSISNMTLARSSHTATLLGNGDVLLAGGDGSSGTLSSAEVFDPVTTTFTATNATMSEAREGHCAILLRDGRVLIVGGENSTAALKSAEIFDPGNRTFVRIADMNKPRWAFTATLLLSGKVLIAGGYDNSDAQAGAELFDPTTNSFTQIQNMIFPRMHHTATLLADGKVLIAGGWSSESPITPSTTAELFDPATNTFTRTGNMTSAHAMHSATLLQSGQVLVLGGTRSIFSIDVAELYDAGSQRFVTAVPLTQPRHMHTATLLSAAQVLVVGGAYTFSGFDAPEHQNLVSAELFDPTSKPSHPTATLNTARAAHTATLLNDGSLLVTGGADNNGVAVASAELYK